MKVCSTTTGRCRRVPFVLAAVALAICGARVHADEQYSFLLSAGQVVGGSTSTASGAGRVAASIAGDEINFAIEHDVAGADFVHLRQADWGTNGPILTTFATAESPVTGSYVPDPDALAALREGLLYIEVYSPTHPNGSIRGQIDVNPDPQPGDVIITEIMYWPDTSSASSWGSEWIELYNASDADVDVGGWFFRDEDTLPGLSCIPRRSGSFLPFVLRAGRIAVVIPDGDGAVMPNVDDFKTAWGRPEIDVIQLLSDGTAGGRIVGDALDDAPVNDGDPFNDLPLSSYLYQPCNPSGAIRVDNEVLTLDTSSQIMDVVNLGSVAPWPVLHQHGHSITVVTGDYPDLLDESTFNAIGNDEGSNWRRHVVGDSAGGFAQDVEAGVYDGQQVGSPGYLAGASIGNQPPVASPMRFATAPGATEDVFLEASDATRPLFGFLLFIIKSLPAHGRLVDVASNHVITSADVQGSGYLMPHLPFDHVRYESDGTCAVDHFEFQAHDGALVSNVATVQLFVQCGDVLITEIMYDPDSLEDDPATPEWVEIFNASSHPVDLTGWRLSTEGGNSGDFPPFILGSGSVAVVIPPETDLASFASAWCGAEVPTEPCPGDVLELRLVDGENHFLPGEIVQIELHQRDLRDPVRGFQAFLQFDSTMLTFLSAEFETCETSCPPDEFQPYGVVLLDTVSTNRIGLAAGINDVSGQVPTDADAPLAILSFVAGPVLGATQIEFNSHDPPSRFSDTFGDAVQPCLLRAPTIWIDAVANPCPEDRLELHWVPGPNGVRVGEHVFVELWQRDLSKPVRGFQAFLSYDSSALTHVATEFGQCPGSCPPDLNEPYSLILKNEAQPGFIDLAAGIDDLNGQPPTQQDALLARLDFIAKDFAGLTEVSIRAHDPPSRYSDRFGNELLPCRVDADPIALDKTPAPVPCPIIRPTCEGQMGPGGVAGASLSNERDSVALTSPGVPRLVSDAVLYEAGGIDPTSLWPDVGFGGPSIYITPPASRYLALSNDDPVVWDVSSNGQDGAYLVTPNAVFNNSPAPPFQSSDTGSPAFVAEVVQGDCGSASGFADGNGDGNIDLLDFGHLALCLHGPEEAHPQNCTCYDVDGDDDVDLADYAVFAVFFDAG